MIFFKLIDSKENMVNIRKIKLFFKFHWIKVLVVTGIVAVVISLVIFIKIGISTFKTLGPFFQQSMLAGLPIQLYLYVVGSMFSGAVFVFLWYYVLFRRGGQKIAGIGKKSIKGKDVSVKWQDIIGMEEAKQEAMEVVKLIKDRAQLQRMGGRILRGILMLGPPGCGKTYLAKGIATETDLPFISMSGSEFVEMFVGVGASRIRKLFSQARMLAYAEGGCIIFIDEIDAVGAQRALDRGFGGTTEHNTTLNQLLVEMDGLKEKDYNVVVIGATNALESNLDQALLRPGRFDRKIYVHKPNLEERIKIFEYYLSKIKYDKNIDLGRLGRMTVDKSPADIANIVSESTLIAIRNKKDAVSIKEISEAMERIDMGIKHRITFTPKEKEMTAYHEAGHLIITYLHHPTDDVFKATIIPRGPTLGAIYHPPTEELHTYTRERILGNIKSALAGYAAEKLKFNTTTSGVSADFKHAMFWAHAMVWQLGMGKSNLVGDYSILEANRNNPFAGFLSEKTKDQLNSDVQEIMQECLKEVEETIKKEQRILDRFAQELVKKEELEYDEIQAIFKEYGYDKSAKGDTSANIPPSS
jgi:cell division protease FtsH